MNRSNRPRLARIVGSSYASRLMSQVTDGSNLTLDFRTGVLDPRLSFSRGSPGTFINANGLVATASTNTPRFDNDPTTLAPRGLLIEAGATNELQRSNAFNTSPWYTSNFNTPSIASPSVTDPGGGTDTWYCVPSGAGAVLHGFRYNTTFTAVAHTFSIWAKAAQHDKFVISDASGGQGACRFDLTAKTANVIANIVTPTNPQIIEYPNGWFRCSFTMVMAAATRGMTYSSYPTGATVNAFGATFTATGTDGMYFYGAQTEIGSGASSYIATEASTGIRAADNCYMDGTNFSSWFTNNAEGSFLVRYSMNNPSAFLGSGIDRYAYEVSNSSGTSRVFCNASYRVSVAGDAGRFPRVFDLGTIDLAPSLVATAAQNTAFAWGYKSNDNHLAAVGVTASDTSGSLQTGLDRIHLGSNRSFGSTSYLQGCILLLKYWPTRLPNAQLQSLIT